MKRQPFTLFHRHECNPILTAADWPYAANSVYAIVYTAYSRVGPGLAPALTEDFNDFERYGMIMAPEDKDAALFPHRIGGKWALIHRPVSAPGAHMWMS